MWANLSYWCERSRQHTSIFNNHLWVYDDIIGYQFVVKWFLWFPKCVLNCGQKAQFWSNKLPRIAVKRSGARTGLNLNQLSLTYNCVSWRVMSMSVFGEKSGSFQTQDARNLRTCTQASIYIRNGCCEINSRSSGTFKIHVDQVPSVNPQQVALQTDLETAATSFGLRKLQNTCLASGTQNKVDQNGNLFFRKQKRENR